MRGKDLPEVLERFVELSRVLEQFVREIVEQPFLNKGAREHDIQVFRSFFDIRDAIHAHRRPRYRPCAAFPFVPFLCKHFRKFFPCPDIRRFPVEISAQLPEEYVLYILEFMEFLFEKTTVMRPFESMFLTIDWKELKCEMKVPPPQPLPWLRCIALLWRVWEVARQNVAERVWHESILRLPRPFRWRAIRDCWRTGRLRGSMRESLRPCAPR